MTTQICPKCGHVSHFDRRGDRPCRVVECKCDYKFNQAGGKK